MYRQRFGRDREYGGERSFAPVKVGQELDVKIEAVGEKGDGVAKVKGFVIFIPNVKQGDEVRIKVNRVLKKVGFGEVIGAATGEASSESPEVSEESSEGTEESSEGASEASEGSYEGSDSGSEEKSQDSENF
ncbi:MAG: TRAM domain-containing protein [Nanoarchaeota archaeon]